MTNTHCRKAYVSVNLDVDEEGVCHPRFIRWENGLIFQIDQILYKCRAAFQIRKLCGKRRFTLAHECAHQILFQMETDKIQEACRRKYSARTAYSLRELKTREDWNEWQANVLGAAILMPQREIDLAVAYYAKGRKLISYDGTFAYWDKVALDRICQQFGVSKTAAVIRLKQLGHLETRPYSEYSDPLEVWA